VGQTGDAFKMGLVERSPIVYVDGAVDANKTTVYAWSVLTDDYTSGYSGCAPWGNWSFVHTYEGRATLTSPTGRVAEGYSSNSQSSGAGPGYDRADASLLVNGDYGYYAAAGYEGINCSIGGPFFSAYLSTDPVDVTFAQLSCSPAQVTRGSSVTCTVSGVTANKVAGWSFAGGGGSVSGPTSQLSWSGTMVQDGTVTENVTGQAALQATVGVSSRSGWATSSVAPNNVPNGTLCNFVSPPSGSSPGCSNYIGSYAPSLLTDVTGGPNAGFAYYPSNFTINQQFPWHIHPDMENLQSDFALHQYGACGYISAANLKSNVTNHESSSTPRGHYAQYLASLQSKNPGTYLESRVATPQANKLDFHNESRGEVAARLTAIQTDAGSETNLFGPNYNQSNGQFQGYINYPPYVPCNP
jgi:hypothetical protein